METLQTVVSLWHACHSKLFAITESSKRSASPICRFFKNFKIQPYDSAIPLLTMYLKEMKSVGQRDTSSPWSVQHYSQQPKSRMHLSAHQLKNAYRKCGVECNTEYYSFSLVIFKIIILSEIHQA